VEYFGGVTRNALSDNMKQFVLKNERYEFKFSEMVDQWSAHYGINLIATRPRKPKDYGNKIIMETILCKSLIVIFFFS
jgi:transposase